MTDPQPPEHHHETTAVTALRVAAEGRWNYHLGPDGAARILDVIDGAAAVVAEDLRAILTHHPMASRGLANAIADYADQLAAHRPATWAGGQVDVERFVRRLAVDLHRRGLLTELSEKSCSRLAAALRHAFDVAHLGHLPERLDALRHTLNPPARRGPDGFVAQRVLPEPGPKGPWLLTRFDPHAGGITVEVLTDTDVADWPTLHDAPAGEARG